jgi:membrane protein implicated in regulation of membrane protease activity
MLRWMKLDRASSDVDSLVGETAVVTQSIAAGDVGRVELRGTSWTARNHGTELLTNGRRCVVVAVDRLMLIIEPEGVRS